MLKKVLVFFLIGICFLSFAYSGVCATVTDAVGNVINIDRIPQRIVSLNPSATEILYFLGINKELVGVTNFCNFNKDIQDKEKIGGILDPDIEKIVSLSPDIVFATVDGNRKESVELLKNAGLRVFVLPKVNNFIELYNEIRDIAKIVGKVNDADLLIRGCESKLGEIKKNVYRNRKRIKVFLQMGTSPLITTNSTTIISKMIEIAGGVNIAANMRMAYPVITREAVIKENPDVIIVVSMGGDTLTAFSEWEPYSSVSAVKNNKIYVIPAEFVCNIGPRIVEGVERIAKLLYPESFNK